MIEEALRRQLQPIVERRRRLHLARWLATCWSLAGLIGLGLVAVDWLFGWRLPLAAGALCIAAAVATVWSIRRLRRLGPDYQAVARNIEQRHPDLKALLLAAVEQEPDHPDGQLGYLQKQVIRQAAVHAVGHDWTQSISTKRLVLANVGRIAALLFLCAMLSQMVPSISLLPSRSKGVLRLSEYEITVSPADTTVERGAPVVVIARFARRVPPEASLLFGVSGQEPQRMILSRNLEDPVFGGVIRNVASDLLYHIEYAQTRTRDYSINVYECPELVRADARIVYPAYTNLPEKVIEDVRQVSVVEGSKVTLTFTLNKAVATARLAPRTGIALGLSVDSDRPNVLTTSLTAAESERYELRMADAQGRSNKVPPRFVIEVHKNLPPLLTPTFPNRDVAASPLQELSLEAEVSDDYGLTAYGLAYTLAGAASRDVTLGPRDAADEKLQIQYVLALEELNAEPDQLLTYHFWADDRGPDGRPRRTSSDMYFAEIRPFEEIFRESQSFQEQQNQDERQNQDGEQQGGQGDQLAPLQKQIIIATWNIKQQADLAGGMDDHTEDLDVVRQSQADALEQARTASTQAEDPSAIGALQAAAEHMETSLDHLTEAVGSASASELAPALGAEQLAYQELLKLRQREHQIARGRNTGQPRAGAAPREQQLQQLELTQREDRYETQRLAQSRQQTSRREDLQVLNRLRDLARRQSEVADRLRESQAALRQARTEQERQEALRELRRLRDEQLAALRDVDELQQRMENPSNRRRMAEARERLNESRSGIRQSAEDLEQGMVPNAITSTTRAQRRLEQMRDELQRRTSGQFTDEMRRMRDEAQQLDQQQEEIAENIRQEIDSRQKTLADSQAGTGLADRIERQREALEELLDQMKEVTEQAEDSEPLLSRKLYDTLRRASTQNVDEALDTTGELLRRNLLPQAQEIERRAGDAIEEVRTGVEEAARNVLGDEAESLRLARQQLDELIRQVDEEAAEGERQEGLQPGDPNGPGYASADRQQQTDAQSPAGAGRRSEQQANRQQRPGESEQGSDRAPQQGTNRNGARPQDANRRTARAEAGGPADPRGWGGGAPTSDQWDDVGARRPLTGEEYTQWSDGLRDVEEMLDERDLREEAARVRDRARAIRAEFVRHGNEPQWDLVRTEIADPLKQLRQHISDTLARLDSDNARVPIDRDPVPDRFAELVRTYFENLGGDD